ncbi:MAG: GNAT family N-acetyltransferase [Thermoprotei archaeon]
MSEIVMREILSRSDPSLPEVVNLYVASFPENEREDPSFLQRSLDPLSLSSPGKIGTAHLLVIEREGWPFGFAFCSFLPTAQMGFHAYIALAPTERGKGFGRRLLVCAEERMRLDALFLGLPYRGSICEVERIEDAKDETDRRTRIRRVHFYERLGSRVISTTYTQPALSPDKDPVPMYLMWREAEGGLSRQEIIQKFYSEVYGLPEGHPYVIGALQG